MNLKRDVVYSSGHASQIEDYPIEDIDRDALFTRFFEASRNHTMTSKEVMFSTYQAARYVALRGIAGDVVECGVWRGGSALLAALTVRELAPAPKAKSWFGKKASEAAGRKFWLYDTYEGMTPPTEVDIDLEGISAAEYIDKYSDDGKWCYADEHDVRKLFDANDFSTQEVRLIKGDVVETLKTQAPEQISLLRLDTDWYESTLAELEILYPRLSTGGVLIIDDYGHWEGSRRAVDEYFADKPPVLMHRIGYAVRVIVKV